MICGLPLPFSSFIAWPTKKPYSNKELDDGLDSVCQKLDLTILGKLEHKFDPHGYTTIRILSESHIALHYWPEYNFVHLDLVCCKEGLTVEKFTKVINEIFYQNNS
jgi:S-adenosylmethionine decarboxylase